jgi:eukaryotic-like serine/threonine-protein kinase
MSSARFRQIEALYHAACEATPDERAALLARANSELREEVELLLSQRERSEFLDRPAIEHAIDLLES